MHAYIHTVLSTYIIQVISVCKGFFQENPGRRAKAFPTEASTNDSSIQHALHPNPTHERRQTARGQRDETRIRFKQRTKLHCRVAHLDKKRKEIQGPSSSHSSHPCCKPATYISDRTAAHARSTLRLQRSFRAIHRCDGWCLTARTSSTRAVRRFLDFCRVCAGGIKFIRLSGALPSMFTSCPLQRTMRIGSLLTVLYV